jgi:PKD repeat protein
MASAATTAELQAQAQALLQQVQALEAQIAAQGGTVTSVPTVTQTTTTAPNTATYSASCPLIGRILKVGSSGDDVTRLQQYLARDTSVYPEGQVTGYFGSLTQAAVKRWQAKYNIISSGDEATTGYGQVGPRTAAAMSLQCSGGSVTTKSTSGGGLVANPGISGGFIQVAPISGNAPLSVKVTATVNTAGSCSGAVYVLSWGDGTIPSNIGVPAGQCNSVVQNYGHTYIYGGTYIITLSSGSHSTSATVVVSGVGAPIGGGTNTNTNTQQESFNASVASGTAPLAVTFTGLVTGADAAWCASGCSDTLDFGDGSTGTVPLPTSRTGAQNYSLSHTYTTGGTFAAILYQGAKGATQRVGSPITITVTQGAYAPFSLSPNVGGNPLAISVQFDIGGCPTYTLNWGDGTSFNAGGSGTCTSSNPSYSHIYGSAGSYTVTLTRASQVDTASITISY